jgi:hypothetical protein
MKSNKQKRTEIKARRSEGRKAERISAKALRVESVSPSVRVNVAALAPSRSYGSPAFLTRGYYVDEPFTCQVCGAEETWTATQQKWWFEVAKGYVHSLAIRCAACRRVKKAHSERSKRGAKEKLEKKGGIKA